MKTQKINEKEFSLPEKWEEIITRDYISFIDVIEDKKKGHYNKMIELIYYYAKEKEITKKDIMMMDSEDFDKIIESLSFFSEPINGELKEFIEYNGKRYKPFIKFEKLLVGEQASIEYFISQTSKNYYDQIIKVFSVFLREMNEDGTLQDFDADKIEDILCVVMQSPILDVTKIVNFFLNSEKGSSIITNTFSDKDKEVTE